MRERTIRLLLVEELELVRTGVRLILEAEPEFRVVGEAATGQEALHLATSLRDDLGVDVVLTDLALPGMHGFELTSRLKAALPGVRVIFLTMLQGIEHIKGLLASEANGYVLKQSPAEELPVAIRAAMNGETYLSPPVTRRLIDYAKSAEESRHNLDRLTKRERQILELMAAGVTSKAIGRHLGLTTKTVENYRSHILEKLDVANTAAAVMYAYRHGLDAGRQGLHHGELSI